MTTTITMGDATAINLVSQTLNDPVVRSMNVTVGYFGLAVNYRHFERIAEKVDSGSISVRHAPNHPHAAEYKPLSDLMLIKDLSGDVLSRGEIMHEAVHAICDFRHGLGIVTQYKDEEPFAYIVQMYYIQHILGTVMPSSWRGYEAETIWNAAWPIAAKLRAGTDPTNQEYENLQQKWQEASPGISGQTPHNGIS